MNKEDIVLCKHPSVDIWYSRAKQCYVEKCEKCGGVAHYRQEEIAPLGFKHVACIVRDAFLLAVVIMLFGFLLFT